MKSGKDSLRCRDPLALPCLTKKIRISRSAAADLFDGRAGLDPGRLAGPGLARAVCDVRAAGV